MSHPFPYSIKRHGTTLEECDHEPVQTPGCAQSHGVLLALSPGDLTIQQVSENSADWLGQTPEQLLNTTLDAALGSELATSVRAAVSSQPIDRTPLFVHRFTSPQTGRTLDACVHHYEDVVLSLLSNAVKFKRANVVPVVTISSEKSHDTLKILVADNGIGIEDVDRDRVFRIFEWLNPKTKYDGTGIGLAIVKKAVERLSGAVGDYPNPGEGCTFWFELPLAK